MAALNASVQRAKESRGASDEHATVHEMKPRKKADEVVVNVDQSAPLIRVRSEQ